MRRQHEARGAPPLAVTFGPPQAQLFGLYHGPDPSDEQGVGVVLCSPLGHEAMSTHRAYRHLAERLAEAGVHALRFDYHGTGDSAGQAGDPGRVRAWLDSIGAAIDELRALSGVRSVDLVGVRFGATLAARVAEERRDIRGLVLWAPCSSGRVYVRELRAFSRLGPGQAAAPGDEEDVAGYPLAEATARDLGAIDLLACRERVAERALVIPRDDVPSGEGRVAAHLQKLGVEVSLVEAPGYASMLLDPQLTVVPVDTLDAIVAWVCLPGARRRRGPRAGGLVGAARGPQRHLPRAGP